MWMRRVSWNREKRFKISVDYDILAEDQNRLARSLTIKLLTFATDEMGFSDRAEIDRIVQESAEKNYGVRDLIHLAIDSSIFKRSNDECLTSLILHWIVVTC